MEYVFITHNFINPEPKIRLMLENNIQKRKILDLGCGQNKLAHKYKFPNYDFEGDVIGLDFIKTERVDVVYDLNKGNLPFKDNTFDIVYTHHCLEHLESKNIIKIIFEVYRILKKGGVFLVRVPHLSYINSLGDLTHQRLFGWNSMDIVIFGIHAQLRDKKLFRLVKRKIVFSKFYRMIGIESLANHFPEIYNCFFTGIFQAREMHFELEK